MHIKPFSSTIFGPIGITICLLVSTSANSSLDFIRTCGQDLNPEVVKIIEELPAQLTPEQMNEPESVCTSGCLIRISEMYRRLKGLTPRSYRELQILTQKTTATFEQTKKQVPPAVDLPDYQVLGLLRYIFQNIEIYNDMTFSHNKSPARSEMFLAPNETLLISAIDEKTQKYFFIYRIEGNLAWALAPDQPKPLKLKISATPNGQVVLSFPIDKSALPTLTKVKSAIRITPESEPLSPHPLQLKARQMTERLISHLQFFIQAIRLKIKILDPNHLTQSTDRIQTLLNSYHKAIEIIENSAISKVNATNGAYAFQIGLHATDLTITIATPEYLVWARQNGIQQKAPTPSISSTDSQISIDTKATPFFKKFRDTGIRTAKQLLAKASYDLSDLSMSIGPLLDIYNLMLKSPDLTRLTYVETKQALEPYFELLLEVMTHPGIVALLQEHSSSSEVLLDQWGKILRSHNH